MQETPINPTDIAVIAVLLLSALLAFARGFVREVLSVGAWAGAAVAAIYAFPHVQPLVASKVPSEIVANGIAGVSVFLVVLIVLSIIGARISRGVRSTSLSTLDRSLGFLFGIARGALLVCLAYLLVLQIYPTQEQPSWLRDARTMPAIENGTEQLLRLVPDSAKGEAQLRAEAAASAAKAKAEQAAREEILRNLSTTVPAGTNPGAAKPETVYKTSDQKGLESLIENTKITN